MSDIKQDRSPRSPRMPLEAAIELAKRFYDKAGKSSVKRDVAMKAMGYAGSSGASLTSMATLGQYGLIEKDGGDVKVSPLALKIFHPTTHNEAAEAIREAAITPNVFKTIFEAHHDLSEDVLANHLIHQGFTQDASKKAASVYKENCEFAKLDKNAISKNTITVKEPLQALETKDIEPQVLTPKAIAPWSVVPKSPILTMQNPALRYLPIPLDIGDAPIPVGMSEDDFSLLMETLNLWKKKIVRPAAQPDLGNPAE